MEALDAPYLQTGFWHVIKKRAGWLAILLEKKRRQPRRPGEHSTMTSRSRRVRPLGGEHDRGGEDVRAQPGSPARTPSWRKGRDNTARAMGDAPEFIKRRHIENCAKADAAYGAGVAKALGL